MLGIPHASLRMVKEKQQLTNPSSFGGRLCIWLLVASVVGEDVIYGFTLSTQVVNTAF
jgi:hypothetical protein